MQVYLNGEYLDAADAAVSIDERGFLFADGVYEAIRSFRGGILHGERHIQRMREGLAAIRIENAPLDDLMDVMQRLLDANGLRGEQAFIYVQVTRGAAPRKHNFPPAGTRPTVFVSAKPFTPSPDTHFTDGATAITVPDTRWSRCDIKSIALLPNVLANQAAKDAGAFEALFVRDGVIIEGSHSNVCAVIDGTLVTYPACNYILAGITRADVLQLAGEFGIPVREGPILQEQVERVQELFICGTTTDIMPMVQVDGRTIGEGRPGPVTRRLLEAYRSRIP